MGSACSGCRCRGRSGSRPLDRMPGHGDRPGALHHDVRLAHRRSRLDVHAVLRAAGHFGGDMGRLARARRPAQGGRGVGVLLVRRLADLRTRRGLPSTVDAVARFRRHRRHRLRARLHLAGVDADQVVPRPARHGDGHGDHGLRRRRDDRRTARQSADELLPHRYVRRGVADLRRHGGDLFRVHARRARSAIACHPQDGNPKAGRRARHGTTSPRDTFI